MRTGRKKCVLSGRCRALGVGLTLVILVGVPELWFALDISHRTAAPPARRVFVSLRSGALAAGKSVLKIAEDTLPTGLNPLTASTMVQTRTMELIHDSPFAIGQNGDLVPSLLETDDLDGQASFIPLPGGKGATGKLARATFHNGDDVTVDDLDMTLQAYAEAVALGTTSRIFSGLIEKVEATGPDIHRDFKLTFAKTLFDARYALNIKLLPRNAFKNPRSPASYLKDERYNNKPIGAGPFEVVSDDVGVHGKARMILAAHEGYHPAKPKIDEIQLIAVPDPVEKINQLRAEQVDVVVALSQEQQIRVDSDKARAVAYPLRNWWYLGFNCKQPYFRTSEARGAISMLVNRQSAGRRIGLVQKASSRAASSSSPTERSVIVDDVSTFEAASVILISGPFVPESPYYNRDDVPQPVFDSEEGEKRLATLPRFTKRGKKWYYGSDPLVLELVVDKDLPDGASVANQIAQDLEDSGISVNKRLLDGAEWDTVVGIREGGDGNRFDLVLGRWHFDHRDDISELFRSDGRANIYRYSNREVDELFEYSRVETDNEKRANALQKVHKIVAEDVPALFLWRANQVAAFSRRVKGARVHSFTFYVNPSNWYLQQ